MGYVPYLSCRIAPNNYANQITAKLDLEHLSDVNLIEASGKTSADKGKSSVAAKDKKENPLLALNRLVLEKGHHSMIVSLIAQHFRDKKSTSGQREEFDLVKGKGKVIHFCLAPVFNMH